MTSPRDYGFEGEGNDTRAVPFTMPEVDGPPDDAPASAPAFSAIEIAVARMALGEESRSMAEVAESLGVSQQSISDTVARVRRALGFRRTRKHRTPKP